MEKEIRAEILYKTNSYATHLSYIPRIGESIYFLNIEGLDSIYRVIDICYNIDNKEDGVSITLEDKIK